MDNTRQISKKIDWLDEQRRKDRKSIAELQEQLRASLDGNQELKMRILAFESELAEARQLLKRVEKMDDLLEQYSSDFIVRLEVAESTRTKSEVESERLRQLEREAINKSLIDLETGMSRLVSLQDAMSARKEEDHRTRADINEIRQLSEDYARSLEESQHLISNIYESRRLDGKRLSEISSANDTLRKRVDDLKLKMESLQDASLRTERRLTELTSLETERNLAQQAWIEQQGVTHADRERWWSELQRKSAEIELVREDSVQKLEIFSETHREMQQALSTLDEHIAGIERRADESAEVQRMNHERLQDEWNSFVAEEEKTRATDLLFREEQWRDHDRKDSQKIARLEELEDAEKATAEVLKHLRSMDQKRLKNVFSTIREFMSEYDQDMKAVP
ncbi:MAG: hypothetical protein QF660_00015 [Anaerolineales bacterium]|nr:hypothetical protein [Anaerolineales bacterium]